MLLFIPTYNCQRQVPRVLDQFDSRARAWFERILVVDNRSPDGTEQIVKGWIEEHPDVPLTLLRNDHTYSLGGSCKVAFAYALEHGFSHVAVLHGDDQGDLHDLLPWLDKGEALARDAFLGSRFGRGSRLVNYSWFRIFGNRVFNALVSLVVGRRVTDLGAGLNLYRTGYLETRFYLPFPDDLTFDVHMLLYGVHSGCNFSFFPLTWREEDQVSNARFLRQSLGILRLCYRYLADRTGLFGAPPYRGRRAYGSQVVAQSQGPAPEA